jgi:hypothetical protein
VVTAAAAVAEEPPFDGRFAWAVEVERPATNRPATAIAAAA